MAFLIPIALGVSALAAAGGTAYSIFQGERQNAQQKDALKRQEEAQMLAENRATSQQRRSDMAMAAANQKKPDLARLMQSAAEKASMGAAGTLLTGPRGVDRGATPLSKTSLLGE